MNTVILVWCPRGHQTTEAEPSEVTTYPASGRNLLVLLALHCLHTMHTFTLLCAFTLTVASCSGLSCIPCEERKCRDPSTLDCPWGTVKDICNCCDVCGKSPGQECGGMWNLLGKCGTSLICIKKRISGDGICV
nr:single insulin-like growth factor-binding domain protein-2 [Cherax quadricarinatus]